MPSMPMPWVMDLIPDHPDLPCGLCACKNAGRKLGSGVAAVVWAARGTRFTELRITRDVGTANMQVPAFLFTCFVIIQGKFCSFTGFSSFSGRL